MAVSKVVAVAGCSAVENAVLVQRLLDLFQELHLIMALTLIFSVAIRLHR